MYTDAYIHTDNHMPTLIHSHLHTQNHTHLTQHIHPYPHVQDPYFDNKHEYKSYCQKLTIVAYYMDKLS